MIIKYLPSPLREFTHIGISLYSGVSLLKEKSDLETAKGKLNFGCTWFFRTLIRTSLAALTTFMLLSPHAPVALKAVGFLAVSSLSLPTALLSVGFVCTYVGTAFAIKAIASHLFTQAAVVASVAIAGLYILQYRFDLRKCDPYLPEILKKGEKLIQQISENFGNRAAEAICKLY
jgi:hypothetical protein